MSQYLLIENKHYTISYIHSKEVSPQDKKRHSHKEVPKVKDKQLVVHVVITSGAKPHCTKHPIPYMRVLGMD